MDEVFADILETCLARMDADASIDDCLAAYPQQRGELEAPLRAAAQLRALPRPALPSATRAALETRMLALAAQRRAAPAPSSNGHRTQPVPRRLPDPAALLAGLLRALGYQGPLVRPWLRLAAVAIAVVLVLALGTGAYAAARAIVRAIQAPPVAPTPTLPVATPFTLDGPIAQIAPGHWTVNGMVVVLDRQTTVTGTPQVGAVAHVRGIVQADATLLARTITLDTPTPAPTSVPAPPPLPPNVAPTGIPVQQPGTGPGETDDSGASEQPGKPDKPEKPKPDKPGKPGKDKGKGKD
jgi:hypothetical protein